MKLTKILALLFAVILLVSVFTACTNNETQESGSPDVSDVSETPQEVPAAPEDDSGYEEGTSETDNIVMTAPADKVLLVVSFGTSFNRSRDLTIGGIETALKNAYPEYQVRRAFTSQIIIDKLGGREGLNIDNVTQAMDRLVLDNVKEVVIQPTTIMTGYEYDDVIDEVMPYADKFESFKIGEPLLVSDRDYDEVAELIVAETSGYRADGTAIVYMGHGTEHSANSTYERLQEVLREKGYDDYLIGTVEAEPTLEQIQGMLEEMAAERVVLRPLMIVAGDHANNDMAGDEEDSWKVILTDDGYTVETIIEGLGQIKGIQDLFIRHVQEALNSTELAVTPVASAAGVTAADIKDGTYTIKANTNSAMFKFVDCELTVAGDTMTAVAAMSGTGFDMIYMGTAQQAQADESNAVKPEREGEQNVYTLPVSALDTYLDCAGHGEKSGTWFDHTLKFISDTMQPVPAGGTPEVSEPEPAPAEEPAPSAEPETPAFTSGQIDVTLTGGSGRATISSPTAISLRDGVYYAQIVWSSPNYTYMKVDGVEYLNINDSGNSTFEIPVVLDTDMDVIGCTVAMSAPYEVEYVLHFDSSTMR